MTDFKTGRRWWPAMLLVVAVVALSVAVVQIAGPPALNESSRDDGGPPYAECVFVEPPWREAILADHPRSVGQTLTCVDQSGEVIKIWYDGCDFDVTGPDDPSPGLAGCL